MRTRYAPSPTGAMHLGHARTALVTWLRARQAGGAIVMRIEDLDPPRVVAGSAEAFLRDHEWLGLDWDEGPVWQSARLGRYASAIDALGDQAYPCTCSRKEVREATRAPHGESPVYPGTCRGGPSHPEREAALRFRMPAPVAFVDRFAGPQPAHRDDFVLRRRDGLHAYQLAVVVDDAEMGITEVVRGDDLRTSTPLQIALHEALGHRPPAYLHVPLVSGADGERLAKRHGAPPVAALREAGWSRERVLGVLARGLGIELGDAVDLETLRGSFALERMSAAPVRLDVATLLGGAE